MENWYPEKKEMEDLEPSFADDFKIQFNTLKKNL